MNILSFFIFKSCSVFEKESLELSKLILLNRDELSLSEVIENYEFDSLLDTFS